MSAAGITKSHPNKFIFLVKLSCCTVYLPRVKWQGSFRKTPAEFSQLVKLLANKEFNALLSGCESLIDVFALEDRLDSGSDSVACLIIVYAVFDFRHV